MSERDGHVYDLTATFVELLVTLASASVVGLVTFFQSVVGAGVQPGVVRLSVGCMALAVLLGFATVGRLIGVITGGDMPSDGADDAADAVYETWTQVLAAGTAVAYFVGLASLAVAFVW